MSFCNHPKSQNPAFPSSFPTATPQFPGFPPSLPSTHSHKVPCAAIRPVRVSPAVRLLGPSDRALLALRSARPWAAGGGGEALQRLRHLTAMGQRIFRLFHFLVHKVFSSFPPVFIDLFFLLEKTQVVFSTKLSNRETRLPRPRPPGSTWANPPGGFGLCDLLDLRSPHRARFFSRPSEAPMCFCCFFAFVVVVFFFFFVVCGFVVVAFCCFPFFLFCLLLFPFFCVSSSSSFSGNGGPMGFTPKSGNRLGCFSSEHERKPRGGGSGGGEYCLFGSSATGEMGFTPRTGIESLG